MRAIERRAIKLWAIGLVLCVVCGATEGQRVGPLPLKQVRTGRAVLRQKDRTTLLEVALPEGSTEHIPLTHTGEYPQGRNGPFAAKLIAEVPGRMLIFTDSFASNPGNVEGECGASPTGERFLHVVSLSPPGHETLSVQVESCLSDIEPERGTPAWDTARETLTVRSRRAGSSAPPTVYTVAADGAVTRTGAGAR